MDGEGCKRPVLTCSGFTGSITVPVDEAQFHFHSLPKGLINITRFGDTSNTRWRSELGQSDYTRLCG